MSDQIIHFLSSWSIKTGPSLTDGVSLERGDVITITAELRRWNTTSGWSWLDIADNPDAQRDTFGGRVVMGIGPWPTNLLIDDPAAPPPYWVDQPPDDSAGKYLIRNSSHRYSEPGSAR